MSEQEAKVSSPETGCTHDQDQRLRFILAKHEEPKEEE